MTEPRLPGDNVEGAFCPDGSRTLLELPTSLPLVLDLDGTLITGDLLYLSFFSILRRNPLIVVSCAAWLTRGRAAQWRPCKIEPAALKEVDDWLENYRRFWEAGLDRLEEYLGELQAKEKLDASPTQRRTMKRKSSSRRAPSKK